MDKTILFSLDIGCHVIIADAAGCCALEVHSRRQTAPGNETAFHLLLACLLLHSGVEMHILVGSGQEV